jgi:hypothetical protein
MYEVTYSCKRVRPLELHLSIEVFHFIDSHGSAAILYYYRGDRIFACTETCTTFNIRLLLMGLDS